MKEVGSPKLLFENMDLIPIQPTLWTKLHQQRTPLGCKRV